MFQVDALKCMFCSVMDAHGLKHKRLGVHRKGSNPFKTCLSK